MESDNHESTAPQLNREANSNQADVVQSRQMLGKLLGGLLAKRWTESRNRMPTARTERTTEERAH